MVPFTIPVRQLLAVLGSPPSSGRADWLAERVIAGVVDGRLPAGGRLPSERILAEQLDLSRGTVVRALESVQERGFLRSRRGSGRVLHLPRGASRPLEALGGDASPAPEDTVDLRSTLLPPHPGLREAAQSEAAAVEEDPAWGSAPPGGLPELIESICDRYGRRGLPTSPEQILVTTGAVSGLHLALRTITAGGDRVGTESPGYPNTAQVIRGLGRHPVPLDVTGAHEEVLREAVGSGHLAAAVLTPDFHNPSGRLLGAEARERLLRAARRSGTALVVDETLEGMNWRDLPMPPPMADAGREDDIALIGSTSKSLWAGLRIGWIRAPEPMIAAIARQRAGVDLGAPVLEQRIAGRLLPAIPTSGVPAQAGRLHGSWRRVSEALSAHLPHWEREEPEGGLSVWCTGLRRPAAELVAGAREHGLLIPPGPLFSVSGQGLAHALRLPLSAAAADLERAVAVLGELEAAGG